MGLFTTFMRAPRSAVLPFLGRVHFSVADFAGHSSFLLLALSFGLTDILDLRVVALAAGASMAVFNYWHPNGKVLWLPFRWNLVFICVNLANILVILHQRRTADRISPEEKMLFREVFEPHGLDIVDFHRLVQAGEWRDYKTGDKMTEEGVFNSRVILLAKGEAEVHAGGKPVYSLKAYNFIGEMGLHVGLHLSDPTKSTATVTTTKPSRCLVWKRGSLIDLLEESEEIAHVVVAATSADLLRKLNRPTQHKLESQTRDALRTGWYDSIVHTVLAGDDVTEHDKAILKRFRRLHHITDQHHEDAVAAAGWTVQQFQDGTRRSVPSLVGSLTGSSVAHAGVLDGVTIMVHAE